MTPAVASERSIFSKNHDWNSYNYRVFRVAVNKEMAALAEVSEKRSNFRIRQFKEKCLFNIAANLTLNTMAPFVILLTVRTTRTSGHNTHTHTHTHTQDNYYNPWLITQYVHLRCFGCARSSTIMRCSLAI